MAISEKQIVKINNKWGISMRLDKLNDWVKVLVAQLIAGVFTIIFLEIYYVTNAPLDMYLMFLFSALMVVYYVFAGIFLRKVKTYKMIVVWVLMVVAAAFTPRYMQVLLLGGMDMFNTNFTYFIEDLYKHIEYSVPICFLSPFIITYISMKISRSRDKKLQPYLDEIMAEKEKSGN